MALDPVTGALISAGASTGSNVIGNIGNKASQKRADAYNLAQWHRNNSYNHPSAQMQRLQQAGLNPHLVYGGTSGGTAGQSSAKTPSKASEFNFDNPMKSITDFSNVEQRELTYDNLRAQNDVLIQDSALKASMASLNVQKTSHDKFNLGLAKSLEQNSLQVAQANLVKIKNQNISLGISNKINKGTINTQMEMIRTQAQKAKKELRGQELTNKLRKLEINLNEMGIQKGDELYWRALGQYFNNGGDPFKN